MLLKRRVIERMIEAYPRNPLYRCARLFQRRQRRRQLRPVRLLIDKDTNAYVSEDFGFCQRWRDIGGKIWLDTEGKLTHVGSYNFQGDPGPRFLTAGAPES